jgi:competence ComEA-like helix-hairpin-helix protein
MRDSRDLLLLILLFALLVRVWPRTPPAIGRPEPLPACPLRIEIAGAGVGCVDRVAGLHSGDLLDPAASGNGAKRGRMAPARLAAFALPVNLNHASVGELASLDGVGPRLAERIVAARPFVTVEDLARVSGLGPKRVAHLRDRVSVLDE